MLPRVRTCTTIRGSAFAVIVLLGAGAASWQMATIAQSVMPVANANPGSQSDGSMLLPNGWKVSPAGKALQVGTMPLNLVLSPDGRYAVVTNNGIAKPSFSIVDLANWTVKNTVALDNAFLGLAWSADGTKLYLGRWRPEQRPGVCVRRRHADARPHHGAAGEIGRNIRRRHRHEPRWPHAVRDTRLCDEPVVDRRRHRAGHQDRRASSRALHLRCRARRTHGFRIVVGRPPGVGFCVRLADAHHDVRNR